MKMSGVSRVGSWLHYSPHRHLATRKCAETTVWISSPLPISWTSTALNFFALGWVLWTGSLLKLYTPFLLPSLPHTRILSFPPREVLPHNAAGKKKGWLTPDLFEKCFWGISPGTLWEVWRWEVAQESEEKGGTGPAKASLSQLFCSLLLKFKSSCPQLIHHLLVI